MKAIITPRTLSGTIAAIPSKSYAQRFLIASLLSGGPFPTFADAGDDIRATRDAVEALRAGERVIDCGSSATTARILLQILAVKYPDVSLTCSDQLKSRPLKTFINQNSHQGDYHLRDMKSSQYISGLMFALPLLSDDHSILLNEPLESAGYVDMTQILLRAFNVTVESITDDNTGWRIPGAQTYTTPDDYVIEGDWSSAPVWIAAGAQVTGLAQDTLQPDGKAFQQFCKREGDSFHRDYRVALPRVIDVSQCPDLTPVLAVMAAVSAGSTRITGTSRLRIKESDRIKTVVDLLYTLGGVVETKGDDIIIQGLDFLRGGTIDAHDDHRIVMAATLASCWCTDTVIIEGAEAVGKSYPTFFNDFHALGGHVAFE